MCPSYVTCGIFWGLKIRKDQKFPKVSILKPVCTAIEYCEKDCHCLSCLGYEIMWRWNKSHVTGVPIQWQTLLYWQPTKLCYKFLVDHQSTTLFPKYTSAIIAFSNVGLTHVSSCSVATDRTKITPSLLLTKIRSVPTKSAFQIAGEIASEHNLTPPEKKDVYNQVLIARASRQDFVAQIRRHNPLDSTKEGRWRFLNWLEGTCQAFEGTDEPDEFE